VFRRHRSSVRWVRVALLGVIAASLVTAPARGQAGTEGFPPPHGVRPDPPDPLSVTITPHSVTRAANSGPDTAVFTVTNAGSYRVNVTLSCLCGGTVSCVSTSPDYRRHLTPGQSFPVTVAYTVGAASTASVTLEADPDLGTYATGTQTITVIQRLMPLPHRLTP
jgi:hypothetical protein